MWIPFCSSTSTDHQYIKINFYNLYTFSRCDDNDVSVDWNADQPEDVRDVDTRRGDKRRKFPPKHKRQSWQKPKVDPHPLREPTDSNDANPNRGVYLSGNS